MKMPKFVDVWPDFPAKRLPVLNNWFETDREIIKLTDNRTCFRIIGNG